jgi:nitrogen fixation protein FixH
MMPKMPREFTGFHMLAILIAFFGVIITVNVTMAVMANRTWSGLVVPNSYVASQNFDEDQAEAARQKALGWTQKLTHENGVLAVAMTGQDGAALVGLKLAVKIGHPVTSQFDRELTLRETTPGIYEAPAEIGQGVWDADVTARAATGDIFRLVHRFEVRG